MIAMSIPMSPEYLLYYVPLLVAVSLVLSATRHERADLILRQAISHAVWFTVFMLVVAAVLLVATWFI
jgi:hypothetical protein